MSDPLELIQRARLRRFRPYPEYKDSGVAWLGEVPAHWETKRWRYCCRVTRGLVDPTSDTHGDRIMIAPNHVESGTGRILYTETAREQGASSGKFVVAPGNMIYSKIRPALNKACIAQGDWLCSADMYPVQVTAEDLLPGFLLYATLSDYFVQLMVDESMRVAMPKVNRETLSDSPLLLPPLPEQRAIAAFLDRETAKIDGLVARKERLIELLQEKRTALITRAVTQGLDPNVPMKDSGVEWLGEIPAHWEVSRIKFIAQVGNGSTPNRDNAEYWGGEYPWLNSSVVNLHEVTEGSDFVTGLALAECHLPRVFPPAVLVGITGEGRTRGMATVLRAEATINQHLAFIRPTCGHADVEYLRYVFHSAYRFLRDESGAGGSTKGALTCEQLENMPVAFPHEAEQRAIAAFLDRETTRIDALIAKVREAVGHLKEFRTALISAAVTGKIDVREAAV